MEFLQNIISLPGSETVQSISFPGLGLNFDLNRVAVVLFGLPIYWYGAIIMTGLLLAVFLCSKWGSRFGITEDQIIDMMLFAVPIALVAIRAYYVIFNLDFYRNGDGSLNWGEIFSLRDGGLAIYGAILSSVVVLLVFCRVRKIRFLAFADLGVHGLFIGQLIGRWGNFMNVEAFGSATTLPWRMCGSTIAQYMLSNGYVDKAGYQSILSGSLGVHPTFLYESLWNFVGLLLVYRMGKKRKFDGQCFLFYVFWYGTGRAWIEGLRTDSLYFFGLELFGVPIRTSQMLAAVSALVAGVILLWKMWRGTHRPEDLYVNQLAAAAAAAEEDSAATEDPATTDEQEWKGETHSGDAEKEG